MLKIIFLLKYTGIAAVTLLLLVSNANAQVRPIGQDSSRRVITPAIPFLTITPDSRSGGMGDAGAAISADANSTFWNLSKLAFAESNMGFSISHTPWLTQLIDDMSITNMSFYRRLSKREVVSASMRYFDMGKMDFTDASGNFIGDARPREMAMDVGYATALSDRFSIAGAIRYIHSNLTNNYKAKQGGSSRPANTAAVDLSVFYKAPLKTTKGSANIAFAGSISNFGAKVTYNSPDQRDFIPTNLRLGTAYTKQIDEYNKFTVALDFNKLMIPSPSDGSSSNPANKSLMSGILGSFSDAPDGISEEVKEVMVATGAEYWYNNLFALRGGYFYEHQDKGGRQFFTMGLGLRYQQFGLDFAYLLPTSKQHPLANTLRFSLHWDFDSMSKSKKSKNTGKDNTSSPSDDE